MATLPQSSQGVKISSYPSCTYRFDRNAGKLVGMIDGIDAIRQSAGEILAVERFMFPIFSGNHGRELDAFIGQSELIAFAKIEHNINEALTQDDRISGTQNFTFNFNGEGLSVSFDIITRGGKIIPQEVAMQ